MAERKRPPPDFLEGRVIADAYRRWLARKAVAHARRDLRRSFDGVTVAAYLDAIYGAVVASLGRDCYTGEEPDWHLVSQYDNDTSFDDLVFAWQVLRQWLSRDFARIRRRRRCAQFAGAILRNEVLQARVQLFNLAAQLLGLAAELHALEFGQLKLELFDFERAHIERLFQRGDGVAHLPHFATALTQQCL